MDTSKIIIKKYQELIKIWILILLKNKFIKCYKAVDFPPHLQKYIYHKYIRNVGEEEGFYPPWRDAPPYWASITMNYSRKKINRGEGGLRTNFFENPLEFLDFSFNLGRGGGGYECAIAPENNLSDITVLIDLFHKLISVQDIGRNMLDLHVAQQLPSLKVYAPVCYLTYQ